VAAQTGVVAAQAGVLSAFYLDCAVLSFVSFSFSPSAKTRGHTLTCLPVLYQEIRSKVILLRSKSRNIETLELFFCSSELIRLCNSVSYIAFSMYTFRHALKRCTSPVQSIQKPVFIQYRSLVKSLSISYKINYFIFVFGLLTLCVVTFFQ
jgi:hypothetical protein